MKISVIEEYYRRKNMQVVKRGRPGQHEQDYDLVDESGTKFPLEEKEFVEIKSSTSSWWSFWKSKLSGIYSAKKLNALSSHERGWVAVVDGELREWCTMAAIDTGHLAAEGASRILGSRPKPIREEIRTALDFLISEGRIHTYSSGGLSEYAFFGVRYA